MSVAHVAVIGAGASGTIQALHLLREGVDKVSLIEREREPGRGVAYSTRHPEHLLNVTARRMIVFPGDPDHFARWFGERGGEAEDYAPRMMFGDYVRELIAAAGDRLEIVSGEAVDVGTDGALEVRLSDGRTIPAEAAVLALGNLRPALPPGLDPLELGDILVDDPWFGPIGDGLEDEDEVLLVGTGLTAIDAALTLDAGGFRGRILALSRRGLSPRPHLKREPVAGEPDPYPARLSRLLRAVRKRGENIGWREAVHELRPITQSLWNRASEAERRRFIRHLRPWWDVHRHRIAPGVAATIETMMSERRLSFVAGRIVSAARNGETAQVRWRPRGSEHVQEFTARRIVNCTGPDLDLARSGDRLLDALFRTGRIRPDSCRLGLDVDLSSRAIGANGQVTPGLWAIGPITRGAFWESIAVPDIAVQAQAVAKAIACAER